MPVHVSIEALRAAGKDLFDARETLVENANVHLLHGPDGDMNLSTGGYYRGLACQELLGGLHRTAQKTFGDLLQNFTGLSSAVYIAADLYEDSDLKSALEFAFLEADAPAPLPPYIRADVTSVSLREEAEARAAAAGEESLPEGWTIQTRYPYLEAGLGHEEGMPRYKVVELYDAEGNLMTTRHEKIYPDGREFTESYDRDGNLETRREYDPSGSTYATTYGTGPDGETRIQRTEHQETNSAGGTDYYTEVYQYDDESGEFLGTEVVDEVTVDQQPDAVDTGQGLMWEIQEQTRLNEEQLWREANPHHDESEWRQVPKTRPA